MSSQPFFGRLGARLLAVFPVRFIFRRSGSAQRARRALGVLLTALFVSGISFFAFQTGSQPVVHKLWPSLVPEETVKLVVAKQDIMAGMIVDPNMLVLQEFPKSWQPKDAHTSVLDLTKDGVNWVAIHTLWKGEPLVQRKLAKECPPCLALTRPGYRAFAALATVPEKEGRPSIRPRDRVDVSLNIRPSEPEEFLDVDFSTGALPYLLKNVEFLAVGNAQPQDPNVRVVTLLVRPNEAELLQMARDQMVGITLSLHVPFDDEDLTAEGTRGPAPSNPFLETHAPPQSQLSGQDEAAPEHAPGAPRSSDEAQPSPERRPE